MALSQQKFREIVFQLLYGFDFAAPDEEDAIDFMMRHFAITRKTVREAQQRCKQIQDKLAEIDPLIAGASSSYKFERIPRVERNILRLGVFELKHDAQIPPKVAIAEAIRLCRKFATPEGATFVNAILDTLYKNNEVSVSDG